MDEKLLEQLKQLDLPLNLIFESGQPAGDMQNDLISYFEDEHLWDLAAAVDCMDEDEFINFAIDHLGVVFGVTRTLYYNNYASKGTGAIFDGYNNRLVSRVEDL